MARGRLGRLEGADRARSATSASWLATTCSSPTRAPARRHQDGRGQLDPGQGQPDRHPDRNARGGRDGAQGGYTAVMSTARARPRTPPSPIWPWRPIAGRSRPARWRVPTGWPSTTSSSASRSLIQARVKTRAWRMLLIRRFEEKAGQLYGMGLIGGFCHLYIGQEAVVVGMQMAIKEGDQVITGYRDHGHMLATGMDPKGVMAELTGRQGGYSKGKGGSMHMFSREALLRRPRHRRRAGAARRRSGLCQQVPRQRQCRVVPPISAMARPTRARSTRPSTWRSSVEAAGDLRHREQPLRHGHVAVKRSRRQPDFSQRGSVFGIPGEQVDGMDVRAVTPPPTEGVASTAARARGRSFSKC
jgi:hypothetical protein